MDTVSTKASDKECAEIINRLKEICRVKKTSYYTLAKLTGISMSTVYSIMSGEVMPRLSTLYDICGGLGISARELLGDESNTEMSAEERELLKNWHLLTTEKKKYLHTFLSMLLQYEGSLYYEKPKADSEKYGIANSL